MSFWSAIVAIVGIIALAMISMAKHRQDRPRPNDGTGREAELAREVEDLRQRIAVLERIVTDVRSSKAIADEIENLRDS